MKWKIVPQRIEIVFKTHVQNVNEKMREKVFKIKQCQNNVLVKIFCSLIRK
jgi:hypothetical protein